MFKMSRRDFSTSSFVTPSSNKRQRKGRASIYEEVVDFDTGTNNADELADKRTEESTKNNYRSKVKQLVAFLKTNAVECINENDEIIVPLPLPQMKAFFGRLCQEALRRLKLNSADELNEEDEDVFSISHISTFRAAIVDLYRKQSKRLEPELDKELKNILDGYKKIINKLKQRGLMKLHEGKREISNAGYQLLAQKFVEKIPARNGGTWSSVTFAWTFFVLLWNLMSRSDSVDKLTLNDIRFPANITLKAVYDLWHFGNRNEGIRPYKKLPLNIDIIDQDKGSRSKAKNAIECIENIMRGDGYIDDICLLADRNVNISNLTPIESDTIYEQAYNKLITYISVNVAVRRVDELSYVRVYQLICNRKKQ
jgi:hypothetical protein